MPLMREDVEDDLLEEFGMYYRKEASILVYQNGEHGEEYMIEIKVHKLRGD
jgi:hypothetical protein